MADIHCHRIGIVELDAVNIRREGVGEEFVDVNRRGRGGGIVESGAALRLAAGAPAGGKGRGGGGIGIDRHEGAAEAIGFPRPGRGIGPSDAEDSQSGRIGQGEGFAGVGQVAGGTPFPVRGHGGIFFDEAGGNAGQHEAGGRGDGAAGSEGVVNAGSELHAPQWEGLGAGIPEFKEFVFVSIHRSEVGGVIH